jgi:hypothetical protein
VILDDAHEDRAERFRATAYGIGQATTMPPPRQDFAILTVTAMLGVARWPPCRHADVRGSPCGQ